ncbi:MAG: mechanosensitive ion channel family protein [Acutalibacteraceae bacterium]|nr:mechanosensitive ion channel family protein [Acutalibacteraceae bacterium]
MSKFLDNLLEQTAPFCMKLVFALIVLIGGLALTRLLVKLLKKSNGINRLEKSATGFIISFTKISLNVLVIISAAMILGFPAASIVTVLASAGMAIGLAMQGALSNLAGGIMLVIFKPFKVGDYIKTNGNEGTVTDISVFYTTLTMLDNRCVTLPNGTLTNSVIENRTANDMRRIDLTFSVAYSSDIDKVRAVLLDAAKNDEKVLAEPEPIAVLEQQNKSSVDFTLRAWCKTDDYLDTYYRLNEQVKLNFDENKIEIPFEQLDVHIDNKTAK